MLQDIGIADIIDIAFMTFLISIVLVWFKRSRAAFILTGIIIAAAVYLLAQQFNLVLTTGVFHSFFAVILIALVVIFQEEIRRFFEQIAVWSINPRVRRQRAEYRMGGEVELLVRTINDLAREKIGALIVLRGENLILGHIDAGTELGGRVSEPLLKSLFDPHSAGHDGAVIIEEDRVTQFGAHLPLSKNLKKLEYGGTRHAAALGLSEITDALCLVVSEERGTVSAARHGSIRKIADAQALAALLERFYHETRPDTEKTSWTTSFRKHFKEKIIELALALLLWFVQVYGSTIIYKTFEVPVEYAELPAHLKLVESKPKKVDITFSGPRRSLYFLSNNKIHLFLKTLNLQEGTRVIRIHGSNIDFPQNLFLENISPAQVSVTIESANAAPEQQAPKAEE